MVLEVAMVDVATGGEQDFVEAYQGSMSLVTSAAGCVGMRVSRGIENPSRFAFLVEWESHEAHMSFRETEGFSAWARVIGPYFVGEPSMEHFSDL